MFYGVFDAAQLQIADEVARCADHEEVAQAFIEDDFGRNTAIRAADNHCKRVLRMLRLVNALLRLMRMSKRTR